MAVKVNRSQLWRNVLIIVLAILLVLVLCSCIVIKIFLGRIGRIEQNPSGTVLPEDEYFEVTEGSEGAETPTAPEPTVGQPTIEWDTVEKIDDENLVNILLLGQDSREDENGQRSGAMVIILCSVNPKTGEVSLISFLQDLYVQIPGGYSDNRLRAAYIFGGFELLDATLAENFGISIDGNFLVDFDGLEAIVDMLGGIDIELTSAESAYLNQHGTATTVAGSNHLDGPTALTFARAKVVDGDFGRTDQQKRVLMAMYAQVRSLSAGQLLSLMYNALPYLTTDMTDAQIVVLAYRLLPLFSSLSISTCTVPANDCYCEANIDGMDVLVPDLLRIRQYMVAEYLPLN